MQTVCVLKCSAKSILHRIATHASKSVDVPQLVFGQYHLMTGRHNESECATIVHLELLTLISARKNLRVRPLVSPSISWAKVLPYIARYAACRKAIIHFHIRLQVKSQGNDPRFATSLYAAHDNLSIQMKLQFEREIRCSMKASLHQHTRYVG